MAKIGSKAVVKGRSNSLVPTVPAFARQQRARTAAVVVKGNRQADEDPGYALGALKKSRTSLNKNAPRD